MRHGYTLMENCYPRMLDFTSGVDLLLKENWGGRGEMQDMAQG